MLYGCIDSVDRYLQLAPLEYALRFISERAGILPDGRHDLPDGMYAEIKRYNPAPRAMRQYEAHVRYADVQCVLEGEEEILARPLAGLTMTENLLAEKDIAFFRDPEDVDGQYAFVMRPGVFLLLYPEDAHKTECLTTSPAGRKVIFKIPVAQLSR